MPYTPEHNILMTAARPLNALYRVGLAAGAR